MHLDRLPLSGQDLFFRYYVWIRHCVVRLVPRKHKCQLSSSAVRQIFPLKGDCWVSLSILVDAELTYDVVCLKGPSHVYGAWTTWTTFKNGEGCGQSRLRRDSKRRISSGQLHAESRRARALAHSFLDHGFMEFRKLQNRIQSHHFHVCPKASIWNR